MRGFACFGVALLLLAGPTAAQVGGRANIVEEVKRELEARKRGLSPFGYKVFETSVFQPDTLYGPVSPDYLVGPGDEVIVNVWGEVEFRYTATVGRDGFIEIPKVGLISVNGLTFRELKERMLNRLSRAYPGISRDPTKATTFVEVSLGRLKPIRVFVIGEVKRPGAYFMSAASSALNALYKAGGPLPTGSLRQIKVVRGGKVVATLDLYDYLLKGRIKEVKLQTDD
ncbi:MAG: sugar ABC transporter substrate-binding protein, partial [Candidatus Latescibacterota bacterium]